MPTLYYAMGNRLMINAYSFPTICWVLKLLPGGLEGYPNVLALPDRLAGDPGVQKVLAREAEGSPRKAERE